MRVHQCPHKLLCCGTSVTGSIRNFNARLTVCAAGEHHNIAGSEIITAIAAHVQ